MAAADGTRCQLPAWHSAAVPGISADIILSGVLLASRLQTADQTIWPIVLPERCDGNKSDDCSGSQAPVKVTVSILLGGLVLRSLRQGTMWLRTETSKSGKAHRYHGRSTCAWKGKSACPVRTVQMNKLDHLITRHLMERLPTVGRIRELLSILASRRTEQATAMDSRLAALERETATAEEKLKRLFKLIEDCVAEMDDLLKWRIAAGRTITMSAATRLAVPSGT
jgi:hypothetical protein